MEYESIWKVLGTSSVDGMKLMAILYNTGVLEFNCYWAGINAMYLYEKAQIEA